MTRKNSNRDRGASRWWVLLALPGILLLLLLYWWPFRLELAPLDQSTTRALVEGTSTGTMVSIWDHGTLIGQGPSQAGRTRVQLQRPLVPGEYLVAKQSGFLITRWSKAVRVDLNHATYHFDRYRTGWNPYEQQLTVAAVRNTFHLLATHSVDGPVRAQPLVVEKVTVSPGTVKDLLLVATENDSVYAFDAFDNRSNAPPVWRRRLLSGTETPAEFANLGNCDSQLGVSATPVVDRTTNTLYIVALLQRTAGNGAPLLFRLHALDISTGTDQPGSPMEITDATVDFVNAAGVHVTFDPKWLGNRPGLLLNRGVLYLAFGSHCFDQNDYHGWLLAYDADLPGTSSFLQKLGAFNTTPDLPPPGPGFHDRSGIWQSGFAPAGDEDGNTYVVTGNGPFGGTAYGNSVLKMAAPPFHAGVIRMLDSFTPFEWASWNGSTSDQDLGSGGAMLIPGAAPGASRKLIVAGKPGTAYVIDRNSMGGNVAPPGPDHVLQRLELTPQPATDIVAGGPAYYDGPNGGMVFFGLGKRPLQAYRLLNNQLATQQQSMVAAPSTSPIPVVSSNGAMPGTGVVWVVFHPASGTDPLRLQAFDAENLASPPLLGSQGLDAGLWPPRAQHFGGNSFQVPTVVNGRVYTGGEGAVRVWGL